MSYLQCCKGESYYLNCPNIVADFFPEQTTRPDWRAGMELKPPSIKDSTALEMDADIEQVLELK